MNDDERQQIDRLTARAIDRGKRDFGGHAKAIYANHSAKGLLRSGATIKAAIRQMEAVAREAMTGLLDGVSAVCRTPEAYNEIESALESLIGALGEELPAIIQVAGQQQGSDAASAALGLYRTMKSDIQADLIIARHGFLSVKPSSVGNPLPTNKGGKPLAQHWDVMWSELVALSWNGEFDPQTQADIKKVMFDLLTTKGVEAGDTAVTERARRLWRAIEAKR